MARREVTAEQKQAAAERRERFRALAKQVAELPQSARTALLDRCGAVVTCEGRALSFVNTCLVLTQRPGASMVGGFGQWLKAGRSVRKGESGMGIWVPIVKGKGELATEPTGGEEAANGCEGGRQRFLMGTVFDISQTNPLPVESGEPSPGFHATAACAASGC